jgi:hypothetical protein
LTTVCIPGEEVMGMGMRLRANLMNRMMLWLQLQRLRRRPGNSLLRDDGWFQVTRYV